MISRTFATTVNEQRYPLGHLVNGVPKPWMDNSNLATVARLALFHYVTRSLEDFQIKILRSGGSGKSKTMGFFEGIKRCAPQPTFLSLPLVSWLVSLFYMQLCRQLIWCFSSHHLYWVHPVAQTTVAGIREPCKDCVRANSLMQEQVLAAALHASVEERAYAPLVLSHMQIIFKPKHANNIACP
jgi:hypothetical protein